MKSRLGQILAEEERDPPIDWFLVEQLSSELLGELSSPLPLIVDEYLRGSERRRQDEVFAHAQRGQLLLFLRTPGRTT
ncbi:MAG: hypothetical protein JOZ20_01815 [Sphingomonas sp.]|nr:hypothetical protein [Sphingomonas sp.]MBW0007833.1 hypothetical protein [Sphingomonas sp.]